MKKLYAHTRWLRDWFLSAEKAIDRRIAYGLLCFAFAVLLYLFVDVTIGGRDLESPPVIFLIIAMSLVAAFLVGMLIVRLLVLTTFSAQESKRETKPLTTQKIQEQYLAVSPVQSKMPSVDYRKGTRESELLVQIFKQLENDTEQAKRALPGLLTCKNVAARIKAAAHCLALRICVDQAEKALQKIADDQSYGIFCLNAEITLEAWQEQGYLKVYPEQEIDEKN